MAVLAGSQYWEIPNAPTIMSFAVRIGSSDIAQMEDLSGALQGS